MRTTDRAQRSALALVAAAAGTASVGVAALARAGAALCGHRVLMHHHDPAIAMPGMAGMAQAPAPAPAAGGICPILLFAAIVAATLCVLAVIVLVASRSGAPAILVAAARRIADARLGRLTAVVAAAGALPLVAILAGEGGFAGLPGLGSVAALVAGAFASALALTGAARVVLAFARRLAVAIAAAFRLLAPGSDAQWAAGFGPLLIPAGVRMSRRRPSRAPPALH